ASRTRRRASVARRVGASVRSIYKGYDALRLGGIARVVREGPREGFFLARDADGEHEDERAREYEDVAAPEQQRRANGDQCLAHVDRMTEMTVEPVRHERRGLARLGEGRERVAECPARDAVEHDADREEAEADAASRRGAGVEQALDRRADEQHTEERVMDACQPHGVSG